MSLKFAYTRPDGGVTIVSAAPKEQLERVLGQLTDEQYRAHVIERSIPKDAHDLVELPPEWQHDRSFRDAWTLSAGKIGVDMPKARDIHRNRIRFARQRLFRQLDGEWMKSFAEGDTETAVLVEAQRQRLRDAPQDPRIEAAQTEEELKAIDLP